MRNIIYLFAFFTIFSCKNSKAKTEFETTKSIEINEIVKTIIAEDSLNVSKNVKNSRMLCEELTKLNIYVPQKAKNGEIPPPPPPIENVSIETLLHPGQLEFFSVKDSLYLVQQNSNPPKFKIDNVIFKKVNLTTRDKETARKKLNESFDFYEISIPVFSVDHQKAYVEVNRYCGGFCGNGESVYLEKINGKWKIIDKQETWVS